MAQIIVQCVENCKNSPKKELLKKLTISLVKNEIEQVTDFISDDICWNIVGKHQICGKENFYKSIRKIDALHVNILQIHNIITHGNVGSINGTLVCEQQHIHFCHIYNFTGYKNAKIKTITSYIISDV